MGLMGAHRPQHRRHFKQVRELLGRWRNHRIWSTHSLLFQEVTDSKTCTEKLWTPYQQERRDEANSGSQWPVLRRLRPWTRRKELWLLRVVMA